MKYPIYFCHLPRTGGTTISSALANSFRCIKATSVGSNVPAACLHGHFNYKPLDGTWITFVREPVARLNALYNYYLARINSDLTQSEFLNIVKPNPMVAQLGSSPKVFDFIGIFEQFEFSVEKLTNYLNLNDFKLRHIHYNEYKANLVIPTKFLELDNIFYGKCIRYAKAAATISL